MWKLTREKVGKPPMKTANIYIDLISFTFTIIIKKKKKKKKNSNGLTSSQQANFRQDNCELHVWAPFP